VGGWEDGRRSPKFSLAERCMGGHSSHCVSMLKVSQGTKQLFPNTSNFVVVPTKMHDFSFFRNQFLPVTNLKLHTILAFQIFPGV
jgi:hypothetical protein